MHLHRLISYEKSKSLEVSPVVARHSLLVNQTLMRSPQLTNTFAVRNSQKKTVNNDKKL